MEAGGECVRRDAGVRPAISTKTAAPTDFGVGVFVYTIRMLLPQDRLRQILANAVTKAYPAVGQVEVAIEATKDPAHGDYASNVAMKLAKQVHQPPVEVAQHLLAQIRSARELTKAEVAGPGFVNFFVAPAWLMAFAPKILADKHYGASPSGRGRKVVVEFISANPTGPMTLGNGRGAFSGDALANVLSLAGWKVWREYYVNDIGNQVNILAESVIRRYFQQHGIPTEYPDYCYQGEYVSDLARKLKLERMKLQDMMTIRDRIKGRILNTMIRELQRVVEKKLRVKFHAWVRESSLYERHLDMRALDLLRRHDLVADREGALWFRTTAFGDDKDRVLIKKDGEKTYFLSDIALRYNRFIQRGFDAEVIFLGADHHGYVGRLTAAAAALGHAHRLKAEIVQLVRLMRDGREVKMSKRAGTYVTLEEVVDEVGLDAARFFFLMHAPNTHMDFNLDLAKERSENNPVYYVQYAHARIASLWKKVGRLPRARLTEVPHSTELALVKTLTQFPGLVSEVATDHQLQRLPFYAHELASRFHDFYTQCRVIDRDRVWDRRLTLVLATKKVLSTALGLMGVSAPEKM